MAVYEYRCGNGGQRFTVQFKIGEAPDMVPCRFHAEQHQAQRVFTAPHFSQDLRRFRAGISPATGLPYAQSRREEREIEKALGIEFVPPSDMPRHWKEAVAYKEHVDGGGEPLPFKDIITPEPLDLPPLTHYMDEAGFRKGEATHDPTPEHQERQLQQIIAASEAT